MDLLYPKSVEPDIFFKFIFHRTALAVNIYAGENTELPHVGAITNVCVSNWMTFDVTMPADATPVSKSRLLAVAFLLKTSRYAPDYDNGDWSL